MVCKRLFYFLQTVLSIHEVLGPFFLRGQARLIPIFPPFQHSKQVWGCLGYIQKGIYCILKRENSKIIYKDNISIIGNMNNYLYLTVMENAMYNNNNYIYLYEMKTLFCI